MTFPSHTMFKAETVFKPRSFNSTSIVLPAIPYQLLTRDWSHLSAGKIINRCYGYFLPASSVSPVQLLSCSRPFL